MTLAGGATGIGLMAAQALSVNGAKVYIVGRRQEKLDAAVKHHSPSGPGEIIAIQGDITTKDGLNKLVSEIESKEQVLHVLVNNAGINTGATSMEGSKNAVDMKDKLWKETGEKNPEASSYEAWTDTYKTNVAAMYFTTVAFLPLLEAATNQEKGFSGCVILISSMSGITKQSQGGMFSYNSSKGAAIHLNEMLATELANNKIKVRVNSIGKWVKLVLEARIDLSIAPGFFPSEMSTKKSDETGKSHAPKDEYKDTCPAQRPGNDRDMANAILFCTTNQYLNGTTIPVDGGKLRLSQKN